jgi:hypothetical protein
MATRAEIVAEARRWLGTPFHHQGYKRGGGADCVGLICGIALELGIEGAEEWRDGAQYHQYGRPPNPRFLLKTCDHFLDKIEIDAAHEADIFVLSFEREPMHFGLITQVDPIYVVHALYGIGRVVEHRFDALWQSRIRLAYAFRGVAPAALPAPRYRVKLDCSGCGSAPWHP